MLSVLAAVLLGLSGPQLDDVLAREKAGDDEGAQRVADAIVKNKPNFALARLEAARLRLKRGVDLGTAELDLEAALSLMPENPRAHYLHALLLEEQGKRAAARAELETALSFRDSYDEARSRLASLCFAEADWACAEQRYRELLQSSESIGVRLQLAATFEAQGRDAEAEQQLKTVLALSPNHVVATRRLADLYDRTGRKDLARKLRGEPEEKKRMRPLKKSKH